jgi:type II secretory pathway component PulK
MNIRALMTLAAFASPLAPRPSPLRRRGSVLIIVMWIAFGLVSIALYFGHSMLFEYRAAEENAAGVAADEAIEGAARYLGYVLTNTTTIIQPGQTTATGAYRCEAVPVGDAGFWLIGRADSTERRDVPFYGVVDEASKLNLNTATLDMLQMLPRMTPELAAAIVDWRDADDTVTTGGAESETYGRRNPPYLCKNAKFDTLEELHLVAGADREILFGNDINLNGVLDPNEANINNSTFSSTVRSGNVDSGLLEYLTVYSRQPNTGTNSSGQEIINVSNMGSTNLQARLLETFGEERAPQILARVGASAATGFNSLLQFYMQSGMTPEEFAQIADGLSVTNAAFTEGLVNVNTAPAAVLACLPGIGGTDKADQLVTYRRSNSSELTSVAWVSKVLDQASAMAVGPFITTRSYQYSADVAALGPYGRGYRRTQFVFDTSQGDPKIVYRRDRSRLGWALGTETRQPPFSGKELL